MKNMFVGSLLILLILSRKGRMKKGDLVHLLYEKFGDNIATAFRRIYMLKLAGYIKSDGEYLEITDEGRNVVKVYEEGLREIICG